MTGKIEVVTTGLWTGDTGSLSQHHTGSQPQSSSGDYFYNIFNIPSNGEVQYAVHMDILVVVVLSFPRSQR